MITVATLVRDNPDIKDLFDMIKRNMPCEYELVIGDNSVDENYSWEIRNFADEYIKISDKQMFRMGIPWQHNLINSIANTYKMFYVDADEYPVWIHPDIEGMFDTSYVISALRFDFFSKEDIKLIDKKNEGFQDLMVYCGDTLKLKEHPERMSIQDRIYNSRYAQFEGLCHSIFHTPDDFRTKEAGAILLHNKTVREAKDKDRMDKLIDEQFARQNINPYLSSSPNCLQWGKGVKHKFEDWNEWYNHYQLPSGA